MEKHKSNETRNTETRIGSIRSRCESHPQGVITFLADHVARDWMVCGMDELIETLEEQNDQKDQDELDRIIALMTKVKESETVL